MGTFDTCQQDATAAGKSYFGLEFPQGTSTPGQTLCLVLSALPNMISVTDPECEVEVHNGHRLGGAHRLAVYGPQASIVTACILRLHKLVDSTSPVP